MESSNTETVKVEFFELYSDNNLSQHSYVTDSLTARHGLCLLQRGQANDFLQFQLCLLWVTVSALEMQTLVLLHPNSVQNFCTSH